MGREQHSEVDSVSSERVALQSLLPELSGTLSLSCSLSLSLSHFVTLVTGCLSFPLLLVYCALTQAHTQTHLQSVFVEERRDGKSELASVVISAHFCTVPPATAATHQCWREVCVLCVHETRATTWAAVEPGFFFIISFSLASSTRHLHLHHLHQHFHLSLLLLLCELFLLKKHSHCHLVQCQCQTLFDTVIILILISVSSSSSSVAVCDCILHQLSVWRVLCCAVLCTVHTLSISKRVLCITLCQVCVCVISVQFALSLASDWLDRFLNYRLYITVVVVVAVLHRLPQHQNVSQLSTTDLLSNYYFSSCQSYLESLLLSIEVEVIY